MTAFRLMTAIGAVLLASTAAHAHPGHLAETSLTAGFAHPFSGLDHLLVMLLIGFWAGLSEMRRRWVALPLVGLCLAAGFATAGLGGATPLSEAGVLGSLAVLAGLSLFGIRLPGAIALVLLGAIGVLHGHVHGAEAPSGGSLRLYAAGLVGGSLMLMAVGFATWRLVAAWRRSAAGLSRARGR